MCGERKIRKRNCPEKDRLEAESYSGVRSMPGRETGAKDGADLLERILERDNLNAAYRQVKRIAEMGYDDVLLRYNALRSNY
jgi:hypothetical protein